jgi:hypothetical protein
MFGGLEKPRVAAERPMHCLFGANLAFAAPRLKPGSGNRYSHDSPLFVLIDRHQRQHS